MSSLLLALALLQGVALAVLVWRLAPGYRRAPPVTPRPEGLSDTTVTVIVASLNEAARIRPCLEGLAQQGDPLQEVLVVDSQSTDGTREIVNEFVRRDARFRLVTDPPLPAGWIGKVWALQHGLSFAKSEWVLGVDADTAARPGMVAAVVDATRRRGWSVASFAPCFDGQTAGERWLQPSMLMTLVYRFGAPEGDPAPDRVMANGQCFLARRDVLQRHGGYALARGSFADDVTLARALASRGERVGFVDGRQLYTVRSYANARQMWREWGRSFDLTDAIAPRKQMLDVGFVVLVQGLPLLVLLAASSSGDGLPWSFLARCVVGLNLVLFGIRAMMTAAIRGSFAHRGAAFWLSPLADPIAALRLVLSTVRRPRTWRGRDYRTRVS